MKLMRLAVCAAVFALTCGIVLGEDVAALQAKLAAQEARLNDLQAKMYNSGSVASCEAPEAITSLRKNATVTVGGHVNTRYYYKSSSLSSTLGGALSAGDGVVGSNPDVDLGGALGDAGGDGARPNMEGASVSRHAGMRTVSKGNIGDLTLGDTILEFKVDVNEYFDAYVKLNFNDTNRPVNSETGIANEYWFRWKNVCNTGFGLQVGRSTLKFGGIQSYGFFDSYGNGWDDATGSAFAGWGDLIGYNTDNETLVPGFDGEGMFWGESGIVPAHTIWNNSRTIQVTPYWESQDGKIKAEASWFQVTEYMHGTYPGNGYVDGDGFYATQNRQSINHGFGSYSARLTWKPIEGLTLSGSFMNQYARNPAGSKWNRVRGQETAGFVYDDAISGHNNHLRTSNNNFASNLAFEYRPCFFNRVNTFASWTHGWNEGWVDNQDSDSINFGLGFDITEALTVYGTGDYLRVKNGNGIIWNKARGMAYEAGLIYNLPYGVEFKAAWRHDNLKFADRIGDVHTKYKSDTFVVHAGFSF